MLHWPSFQTIGAIALTGNTDRHAKRRAGGRHVDPRKNGGP